MPEEKQKITAVHGKTLLEWKAPEFINHTKGKRWFMGAGVLILTLITYAIYTQSATMVIVFVVLAGVYFMTHNMTPRIIDIKITEAGIAAGDTFYPFGQIEAFWIIYHPQYYRDLNLKLKNQSSKITLQLNEQDPIEVRNILSEELQEIKGAQDSFSDILIRLLRL